MQHPRRPGVGGEHPDRLARLDEQRLVVGERGEGGADGVEGVPRARRPSGAAVHDEVVGSLGHLGIEVVHQHAQRRLGGPRSTGERRAPWRPHRPWPAHRRHRTRYGDLVTHVLDIENLSDQIRLRRRVTRWRFGAKTTTSASASAEALVEYEIRRRPTLPGGLPPSTIGADRLNFRVRDGNGCDPVAMATENQLSTRCSAPRGLQSKHELFNPSPRPISTGRLNTLL